MGLTGIPTADRFPRMMRLKQQFPGPTVADATEATRQALARLALPVRPGQSVALTVGSRGIANIDVVVRGAVAHLQALGAHPFIIPAMGSHGGGTAEGQQKVLARYGITEASWAADPGVDGGGPGRRGRWACPIWLDRHAAEADWIGVITRVKPHTGFTGEIGSGLLKMMMIGMGKHRGAIQAHRGEHPPRLRDDDRRPRRGRCSEVARIAFGLGLVENGYDETALVEAFLPGRPGGGGAGDLREGDGVDGRSCRSTPIDLLIVDEIGKEISGSGMDTNVIGRHGTFFEKPFEHPKVTFIVACDLSRAHRRQRKRDRAGRLHHAPAGREDRLEPDLRQRADRVLAAGAQAAAGARHHPRGDRGRPLLPRARAPRGARVVRIKNTLRLAEVEVSEAFAKELAGRTTSPLSASRPRWRSTRRAASRRSEPTRVGRASRRADPRGVAALHDGAARYSYTPFVVGDGSRRPFHAAVAMFVDQASGFIHGSEMGEPPLSEAFVQERLLARCASSARPGDRGGVSASRPRTGATRDARRTPPAVAVPERPIGPGSSIGWPCGVARAAASHSALRWRSSPAATSPFSATSPSSAASQCS